MPSRCRLRGGMQYAIFARGCAQPPHRRHLCHGIRNVLVHQHRDDGRFGNDFVHQLEPLRCQIDPEKAHSGDVPARPVEARHDAGPDRVTAIDEDDGNGRRCRFGRQCGGIGVVTTPQPGGQPDRPPARVIDRIVPPPSGFRSPRSGPRRNRLPSSPGGMQRCSRERPRRPRLKIRSPASPAAARAPERPRHRRAADKCDELAPSHFLHFPGKAIVTAQGTLLEGG